MGFQEAVATCLRRYAVFEGRARRSEYWWFFLFNVLMQAATGLVDAALFGQDSVGLVNALYGLAVLLPGLAVAVRRLHDVNRSGWWLLISLIPVLGILLLIVWFCRRGDAGPNRFGTDPLPAPGFGPA
jgi:uncharacterized membrane protein YhaH (DUF805 family)